MSEGKQSNTIQAFWLGLGALSSFGVSILSAAILSRYFDKAEYGTYRQIIYVYNTLLVVFSAGLPRVFSYFLPRYTLPEGKSIVNMLTKVLLVCGLGFSLCLFFFSGPIASILKNPELEKGLQFFSIVPVFMLPTLGIEGVFATYQKTKYVPIYNTLSRLIMLCCIVIPVIMLQGGFIIAIYGWVIASVLSYILAVYFKGIPFRNVVAIKSDLKISEILRYSIPLLVASLGGIIMKASDQFYVSRYFGNSVFAEYSNGFMELPFVNMITFSIASVLMPQFSKMIYDGDKTKDIINLWQGALTKSAVLIYPLVFFFFFYSSELMVLLFSKIYEVSSIYFRIALTLNLFNVVLFAPLLISMGETKFYSRLHIVFAVISWVGGFIVILTLGSPVAIAVFSISKSILLILFAFKKVSKLLKVKFFSVFPIRKLLVLALHSSTILVLLRSLDAFFFKESNLIIVGFLFALFMTLLLATSKVFGLNYISSVDPILNKIRSFKRQ